MRASSNPKPRVLYIVYWGAAEPLGQSLVLPAVKKLAEMGAELTLVTFEKPEDLARPEEMAAIRGSLAESGVRWIPLQYHKSPKIPATAWDILYGIARGLAMRLDFRPDIIHARNFIAGQIGLVLSTVLRAKLIYHNEGFYPDEEVDGGVWRAGSAPHRLAKFLDARVYAAADGLIALSHRAKAVIESFSAVQRKETPVVVVPSCVNLARFRLRAPERRNQRAGLQFIYIGSVGKRYILDRIGSFVTVAANETPQTRLRVLTQSEPEVVKRLLGAGGLSDELWSAGRIPHSEMPDELARYHAGLFFLQQGLSEHGCSPTKIGEYWAVGLPVITTPNVSDTDEIVRREGVGVIVTEHSEAAYSRAVSELNLLLADEELSLRCRRAAETHYALGPACERQMALYHELIYGDAQSSASAPAVGRHGL
jgi:glycosyltransferase involved in cell wall biosynthesis